MKNFLKQFCIFSIPIFGLIIVLFVMPVNKKEVYLYITNDCYDRSAWFYQRIFEDKKSVDILFLGTSHTICSVKDSVLEKQIYENTRNTISILNAGYCRPGISLQYLLLCEVLENKKPELVVFEVREQEDKFSHEMFPYLANNDQLFNAPFLFNHDYFPDIYHAAVFRFELIKNKQKSNDTIFSEYGFWERGETATEEELENKLERQFAFEKNQPGKLMQQLNLSYSENYVNRMIRLCAERNIEILFLYLPSYGDQIGTPINDVFYKSFGEMIKPPESILQNKLLWSDEGHLNINGADSVTFWLSKVLIQRLEKCK